MKDLESTFHGKRVLITGHSGFKGSWLAIWLHKMGALVYGLSLSQKCDNSLYQSCDVQSILEREFIQDIRDEKKVTSAINDVMPDFIFHLAAQALVSDAYENPVETMAINSIGTANVLHAVAKKTTRTCLVLITSDKCYENLEQLWGYKETDRLGGSDPYSASKAMAELAINSFYKSFIQHQDIHRLAVGRAGNVIGGGDWSKNRIVPDCVKAWSQGQVVSVRNPRSTRPWQHVLEPLSGYLAVAKRLVEDETINGEAFNFGPRPENDFSVDQLLQEMGNYWPGAQWQGSSSEVQLGNEAALLKLNCEKAKTFLNWEATLDFKNTVRLTVEWYQEFFENGFGGMQRFTDKQIDEYCQKSRV